MDALLNITEMTVPGLKPKAYFVESVAPLNVEEPDGDRNEAQSEQNVREIARFLLNQESPGLVTLVHGFSNTEDATRLRFEAGLKFIAADSTLNARTNVVYVGYRWPSEQLGASAPGGLWSAMPQFMRLVTVCTAIAALALLLASLFATRNVPALALFLAVSSVALGIPLTLMILRKLIYYRDGFRAANYGVPDLLDFFRTVHHALNEENDRPGTTEGSPNRRDPDAWKVDLSFIGHSMGALVVTSLIRIMSDVFDPRFLPAVSGPVPLAPPGASDMGQWFRPARLVLASPDISAEALLLRRSNFLRVALRRFEEAYLFSNEGDAVLRNIGTLANYFAFPTRDKDHGHRLGNVEVIAGKAAHRFGIVNTDENTQTFDGFFGALRVGNKTLAALNGSRTYGSLNSRRARRGLPTVSPDESRQAVQEDSRKELEAVNFSFFECTDFIDENGKAYLTFARRKAKLSQFDFFRLLLAFVLRSLNPRWGIDVHSGYFDAAFLSRLMYGLGATGINGVSDALLTDCEARQVRVLLSPRLYACYKARGLAADSAPTK